MIFDCIIVGQGLCGTLLSRQLINAGKTVLVIDNADPVAAGRVAGGIINPVTGKRLVRTWMIEELMPFAQKEYSKIEKEFNIPIVTACNILDFHHSRDDQEAFDGKKLSELEYLHDTDYSPEWKEYFRFNYCIGTVGPCLLVSLQAMIVAWRQKLAAGNYLREEDFDFNYFSINQSGIRYKDAAAQKIIFCDGTASAVNPYFNLLPWSRDKGEALIVAIPGLPRHNIYKQHISIVPWKDDLFWVGASHDWKYTSTLPTPEFRRKVTEQLDYWLRLPYEVVDHLSALRPANFDRKPFVGFHPVHSRVGIFNGMGGKGCSLAPYFAKQFSDHITAGTPLLPDVDIKRYEKIFSRE